MKRKEKKQTVTPQKLEPSIKEEVITREQVQELLSQRTWNIFFSLVSMISIICGFYLIFSMGKARGCNIASQNYTQYLECVNK